VCVWGCVVGGWGGEVGLGLGGKGGKGGKLLVVCVLCIVKTQAGPINDAISHCE